MTSESRMRVRYAETDKMGVVYYANYLVYLEVGRVDFIRTLGLDYKSMEDEGYLIAVIEAVVRYKASARFDEELVVRTTLAHLRGAVVIFDYTIHRVSDEMLLCEGSTTHMVVDPNMQKVTLPERYAEVLLRAKA